MALRSSLQAAVDAATAAETDDTKCTALVNGVIDATLEALCMQSPVSTGQRQALTVLKAEALTDVADFSAAMFPE